MSSEVIIIIIGFVLILIAILDSIRIKDSSLGIINTKLRVPLGIIGILLIFYGSYSYESVTLQGQIERADVGNKLRIELPVEKVQVISPIDGDSVECRILTMGVYPNSHSKDIWVLLKPSDSMYYPQSDHTNTSYKRNGEWQVITRFGGDKGESYDIIVYETDSLASQYFGKTIQNWKESMTFTGLREEDLPKGANEIDRIAITLKENCRGVH